MRHCHNLVSYPDVAKLMMNVTGRSKIANYVNGLMSTRCTTLNIRNPSNAWSVVSNVFTSAILEEFCIAILQYGRHLLHEYSVY